MSLGYQHEYHAGNHGDVLKHAVLSLVVAALANKDKPFRVLDGWAGSGWYDLMGREARQTAEYRAGIERVLSSPLPPVAMQPYLQAVRNCNAGQSLTRYPGSPELVRRLLRPNDHLELLEIHPRASAALREHYSHDPFVHLHVRDAFEGIPALIPPPERRGLVLIDPSYEVKDDFPAVVEMLRVATRRWANGIFMIWYPLIRHPLAERFPAKLRALGMPELLQAELAVEARGFDGMRGSGVLIVNPPYGLDEQLDVLLPWLRDTLGNHPQAAWSVQWLSGPG